MSTDQVNSLLKSIASTQIKDEITGSYTQVSQSMREIGAPTNNMLLSIIHSETKRSADEIMKLTSRVLKLEETNRELLTRMCDLLENQNIILSNMAIGSSSSVSSDISARTSRKSINPSGEWWYHGTKLSNKYYVAACILSHLIDMVQIHLETDRVYYPDSVDCSFTDLHHAVRAVCTNRCTVRDIQYRELISLTGKESQPFDHLYPMIASSDPNVPFTMSESSISNLHNSVTRNAMQTVEYIRQRLTLLEGILSARQIDTLKSIGFPVSAADSPDQLNWDRAKIKPRTSHPYAEQIRSLAKMQKDEYIKSRLAGSNVIGAYDASIVAKKQTN